MNPFVNQGQPPAQHFPQPQQPPYQQGPQYQGMPGPGKSGSTMKLVLIILAAVLVLAAIVGTSFWFFGSRGSSGSSGAPVQVTVTTVVPPESIPAPGPAPSGGSRPANPSLPGGAVAANSSARNGNPGGNFNNAYTGSSVTSQPFANSVRDVFALNYVNTGQTSAVLNVYSSVTGQTYTMNCTDNSQYVTCTGGNNAVVYIS